VIRNKGIYDEKAIKGKIKWLESNHRQRYFNQKMIKE
jgi:hypothetical protein